MASRRVLVVDDHPDATEMLCLLFGSMGHECTFAHTGAEALELARTFHPEIAVIDIGLPDMSGHEIARELRERGGSRIYLAALSGWSAEAHRVRARTAGFDEYVVKPANIDVLRQLVSLAA